MSKPYERRATLSDGIPGHVKLLSNSLSSYECESLAILDGRRGSRVRRLADFAGGVHAILLWGQSGVKYLFSEGR